MPTRKVWGYEVRDPYDIEHSYFRSNPRVAGMAADDNRITLNPYSGLTPQQQDAVARNEAARLYMREQKFQYDFDPTPEQTKSFAGTAYAGDANAMRSTLLARILSGDASAGAYTPRQKEWADWILSRLNERK
jgi:GH24 family phage-related lysozyme (muramidase)